MSHQDPFNKRMEKLTTSEQVELWFKSRNIIVNCYSDWLKIDFNLSKIVSIPLEVLIEFRSLINFPFSITADVENIGILLWFETRVWGD